MSLVVGIDIGNENCVVAAYNSNSSGGYVDVLLNEASKRETPLLIHFDKKQRVFGSAGTSYSSRDPKASISQLKRLIGRRFNDASFQEERKRLPYETSEGPDGEILVTADYMNKKCVFTAVELLGMFLRHLKKTVERAAGDKEITDCVIGVPSYLTNQQRNDYLLAAEIAGLKPLRLFHDGTATALDYALSRNLSYGEVIHVVFVDIGHCDTQVTVVKFSCGTLTVLAHCYNRELGGRDFDNLIFDHIAKLIHEKKSVDIYRHAKASFHLRAACIKAKMVLGVNTEASVSKESLIDDIDVDEAISRETFEIMSADLIQMIVDTCSKALTEAGLSKKEVQSIELVGSGSRVPKISQVLESFFEQKMSRTLNASECVANGCALQCAMLFPTLHARTFGVQDIFPFSIVFKIDSASCILPKGWSFLDSTELILYPCGSGSRIVFISYSDLTELPNDAFEIVTCYEILLPEESSNCILAVAFQINLHGILAAISASWVDEGSMKQESNFMEIDPQVGQLRTAQVDGHSLTLQIKKKLAMQADESKWKPIKFFEQPRVASNVLDKAHRNETEMEEYDRANEHAKNQRNHLEASLLRMRNEIFAKLKFASKESRNLVLEELDGTEEWLYGLGADKSAQAYINREQQLHMVYNRLLKENESSFYQAANEKDELKSLVNDTWKKLDKGHFHRMQKSERHNLYLRLQETWNVVLSGDLRSKDVYTKEKEALNQLLGSMMAEVETSTTIPQKMFNTISSWVRPGTAPPIDSDKDAIVSQPDNNDMGLGSQQKGASDMAEQKLCKMSANPLERVVIEVPCGAGNPFPDPTTSATIERKLAGQEHAGGGHFSQHETPLTSMCIDGDSQQNDGNKIGDEQAGKPHRGPQKVTSATEGGDEMTGQKNANSSSNNSRLDEPSPERNNGQHVGDNRSIPCSNQQQADNHPPSTHNQQLVNPEYSTTTVDNQGAVISNSGGCLGPESGLRNNASSTGAGEEVSNPQFDIRLKALHGGRSMTVTCSDGNVKIGDLKRLVNETLRMQTAICNDMGKVYNNNRTLRSYGITDGSMLYWR